MLPSIRQTRNTGLRAGVNGGLPRRAAFARLGLVPEGVHLGKIGLVRRAALVRQAPLDVAEAPDELGVGAAQRVLGLDVQLAGQVGADE